MKLNLELTIIGSSFNFILIKTKIPDWSKVDAELSPPHT